MKERLSSMLHLPKLFSDGAVLQREKPVKVWGTFEPFSKIKLSLEDSVAEVITDQDGNFKATLKAPKYGFNKQLIFKNESGETLKSINVSVGDVWILSGQSNMDFMLKYDQNYQQDADKVTSVLRDGPAISFFEVPRRILPNGEFDQSTNPEEWHILTKENAKLFSAIGYYFGLELRDYSPDIPIGLIWMSFSGTTASAWLSEEALAKDPLLKQRYLDSYQELLSSMSMYKYEAVLAKQHETSLLPEAAKFWDDVVMGKIDHKTLNEAYKNKKYLFNDQIMGPKSENRPHGLFDNMVKTIIGYTIKGVLWYQGESNRDNVDLYKDLMPVFVKDIRNKWNIGEFPFYFVEIAPFNYEGANGTSAARMREVQQQNMKDIPNSGMVTTLDIGHPVFIHPTNKETVGSRLALWALAQTYGQKGFGYATPIYKSMEISGNKIYINIDNAQRGLCPMWTPLEGFEIAGEDKIFYPAHAEIETKTTRLAVSCDKVQHPIAVRYAYKNYAKASVFSTYGIPVAPFRTDNW